MVNLALLSKELLKRNPEEVKINQLFNKIILILIIFGVFSLFIVAVGVII